jgi:hypothetical protein
MHPMHVQHARTVRLDKHAEPEVELAQAVKARKEPRAAPERDHLRSSGAIALEVQAREARNAL